MDGFKDANTNVMCKIMNTSKMSQDNYICASFRSFVQN